MYIRFSRPYCPYQGRRHDFQSEGDLEKHMLQKALSLASHAGPTMIGAIGQGKLLDSEGSS